MYVSHKYKLIFLRTPKTASSSLSEFFIRNIPDPNAIYTPVEDSNIPGTLDKSIINRYKINFKYYHFTIEDLINNGIITKDQALNYKCISVIRDPFDRQKSFYYFYRKWKGRGKPASVEQYKALTSKGTFLGEPNSAIRQSDFLKLNGRYIGNYWLYENIDQEIQKLMNKLNLPITHPLPRHKTNFRNDRKNEIEFDKAIKDDIVAAFKEDIQLYNEVKHAVNNQSIHT